MSVPACLISLTIRSIYSPAVSLQVEGKLPSQATLLCLRSHTKTEALPSLPASQPPGLKQSTGWGCKERVNRRFLQDRLGPSDHPEVTCNVGAAAPVVGSVDMWGLPGQSLQQLPAAGSTVVRSTCPVQVWTGLNTAATAAASAAAFSAP